MKIGELSRSTGCPVATLRFYEKEGLLLAPGRAGNNYRIYGEEDARRVGFIMHCRLLGFSLAEIRAFLDFRSNPCESCGWINDLVERHIARIDRQIAALQHFKSHFESLRQRCDGTQRERCGILESLESFDISCCRQMQDLGEDEEEKRGVMRC